nr:zinc finger, CCHC-type [Tanacetum cinerariifolium]
MASTNTMLNIEKLDGNILQKHGGSKQVEFKQLGPGVETKVHRVHDEKHVWSEVELHGAQGDREAKRSTQRCMKSRVAKHLGVAGIQQQNVLDDETNVTLFAKVKCIFLGYHKSIMGNKLWRLDDVTSKVVLYKNMGFNESVEYKKKFIGSDVGTGSIQVLQGVEFEVEPQEDHTFEVEPHGNVNHVDGSQEVQTQDLMDYQLARDREQHLAYELFGYKEDINEAAFAIAAVKKIYAHESSTFNDTVACEVRKSSDDNHDYYWKYALGMFIHLFLYIDDMVFSCGCKAKTWATKGFPDKAKENVLGMEIVRDQTGNTLRVSQSRIHNKKLVQTLLKGHSTLSLDDSLLGDCDVEKN